MRISDIKSKIEAFISSRHYSMADFVVVGVICFVLFIGAMGVLLHYGHSVEEIDNLEISPALNIKDVVVVDGDIFELDGQSKLRASLPDEHYDYPLVAEYYDGDVVSVIPDVERDIKPEYSQHVAKGNKARIAVIIDDMGVNQKESHTVVGIKDYALTLAYLPYAPHLEKQTELARKTGHELMIHMPMEPMNGKIDTGPIALKTGMSEAQMRDMLDQAFASFDGYVGVNNHMGSRLTQDRDAMDFVMDVLHEKGLFYVDSKTIASSVAADSARDEGLVYAERDVFLDHVETPEFVRAALEKVEKIALERGSAIAIGHPKSVTVAGLKEWLPTLEARGFEIVPVSELLLYPHFPDAKAVMSPQGIVPKKEIPAKKEAMKREGPDERSQYHDDVLDNRKLVTIEKATRSGLYGLAE